MNNGIKHVALTQVFNVAVKNICAICVDVIQNTSVDCVLHIFGKCCEVHDFFFSFYLLLTHRHVGVRGDAMVFFVGAAIGDKVFFDLVFILEHIDLEIVIFDDALDLKDVFGHGFAILDDLPVFVIDLL